MSHFQAKKRADGKTDARDLLLEFLCTVALAPPGAGRVEVKWQGSRTAPVLVGALMKRLNEIDSHGETDQRSIARELIIDVIANEPSWKPYSKIFEAFAGKGDKEFFAQLVRGYERKRKPIFDDIDWFLMLNWNESADFDKPLRLLTDENVLELIYQRFPDHQLQLPGYRSKRTKLNLTPGNAVPRRA